MAGTSALLREANSRFQELVQYDKTTLGPMAEAIASRGYPATEHRIRKPSKDLQEHWQKFISTLPEGDICSPEQADYIRGFADTMAHFVHIQFDTHFIAECEAEEDTLREDIRHMIATIQEYMRTRGEPLASVDAMHFDELVQSQKMETFGGLENLKMRLQVFLETHR